MKADLEMSNGKLLVELIAESKLESWALQLGKSQGLASFDPLAGKMKIQFETSLSTSQSSAKN